MRFKSVSGLCVVALLIIACAAGGQSAWLQGKAWLAQALLQKAWTESKQNFERQKPWPWADTWPVARLHVPALGMSLIVLEGLSGEAMAFGPAQLRTGLISGPSGVTLIGGHRDTHLAFLQKLQVGALFELETLDGQRRSYRWAYHWVADSDRDQLYISQQDAGLVLVTCYPFNATQTGGPLRFVMVALPESSVSGTRDKSRLSQL